MEIYEGIAYSNLEIKHGLSKCKKKQYDTNSFLNKYDKEIYCKILEDDDGNLEHYIIVKNKIINNEIIREDNEGNTKFFYIDNNFKKSKELMFIGNNENKDFQWYENIMNSNLINYKKYDENKFLIVIKKKKFRNHFLYCSFDILKIQKFYY